MNRHALMGRGRQLLATWATRDDIAGEPATAPKPGVATAIPPDVRTQRLRAWNDLTACGAIRVGRGTYGLPDVVRYEGAPADEALVIGSFTSIADDVVVLLGGNHPVDRASTYPFRALRGHAGAFADGYPQGKGGVVVGSDVWLGRGALLVSGARVGDGAVVAAGAVVAGSVRPYAIVAGNPAREVRRRFEDDVVDRLLDIRWWEWPDEELDAIVELLNDSPVDAILQYADGRRS